MGLFNFRKNKGEKEITTVVSTKQQINSQRNNVMQKSFAAIDKMDLDSFEKHEKKIQELDKEYKNAR